MRTVGANSTGDRLWLVTVVDGVVVDTLPQSLTLPSGLESGRQLEAMLESAKRAMRDLQPDRVAVLDPEQRNQLNFAQSRRRVVGETLLALACASLDIPCDYLARATLRARLQLPRSGPLVGLVETVIPTGLARNWGGKRDLAALAALAVAGESNGALGRATQPAHILIPPHDLRGG